VSRLTAGNDNDNDERERGDAKALIFVYEEVILEQGLLSKRRSAQADASKKQTHNHQKVKVVLNTKQWKTKEV
jgi:hypothetical protein